MAEGTKEDAESWRQFLRHLKERVLVGVRLVTSDKGLGLVEALGEFYPEADWQQCTVHCYRNVLSSVPKKWRRFSAQEDREAALKKAADVVEKLRL